MNQFRCYSKKSIIVFFVSVICLSAAAEYLICKRQSMWAYPVLMWMPAVSAVVASTVAIKGSGEPFSLKKVFSNTGFHFCKIRYIHHRLRLDYSNRHVYRLSEENRAA